MGLAGEKFLVTGEHRLGEATATLWVDAALQGVHGTRNHLPALLWGDPKGANPTNWTLRAATPRGAWRTGENHGTPNSGLCVYVGTCVISSGHENGRPPVSQSMQVPGACRNAGSCCVGGGCLEGSKEGSWVGREAGGGGSPRAQDR